MNDQDGLEEIRQVFFQECEEHLSVLEDELGSIGTSPDKLSKINTIFRSCLLYTSDAADDSWFV